MKVVQSVMMAHSSFEAVHEEKPGIRPILSIDLGLLGFKNMHPHGLETTTQSGKQSNSTFQLYLIWDYQELLIKVVMSAVFGVQLHRVNSY